MLRRVESFRMDKSAIPRDVAVVIAEDGRKKNPLFIDGLRRNGVSVTVRKFPEELQEAESRNDNPDATMAFVEEFYRRRGQKTPPLQSINSH